MTIVSVKWGKESYDVEIDISGPLDLFKAQLFELTHVPIERQKILAKGKQLKSDQDFQQLSDGAKLMLMGTAEVVPTGPKEKIVFEEDLTDQQKAKLDVTATLSGLQNLGNTCYMNSSLQVLRAIPDVKNVLIDYNKDESKYGSSKSSFGHSVVSTLGSLLNEMDSTTKTVTPGPFTRAFKQEFPLFDQKTPEGVPMQQDADESLSQLLYCITERVGPGPKAPSGAKALFEGQFTNVISNTENKEEPTETKIVPFVKLRCHISSETNYLADGLKNSLVETIEKNSPTLGRNCQYEQQSRISALPPYLNVQFVRFSWRNDTQKRSKILRKVVFPIRLDLHSFCTDDLKKKLSAYRDEVDNKFDQEAEASKDKMDVDEVKTTPAIPNPLEFTQSGVYELFGVITHKGRHANSGHYIGWARDGNSDNWFKFDDDVVSKVKTEDISALSGGGDWHMAYILFYRAAPWRTKK